MTVRLRYLAEYAALRSAVGLLRLLPAGVDLALGWAVARIIFTVFRSRRREAVARIHEVFGRTLSNSAADRIAWDSWRNFIFCIVDMICRPPLTREWAKKHFQDCEQSLQPLLEHRRTGKGAIIASPHMGSWELAGLMLRAFGIPVFSISAREKNPLSDAYITRLRERSGIPTIQRRSDRFLAKKVLQRLNQGEFLAILPDVRAPVPELSVRFLGKMANIARGMSLFARRAKVPIFPSMAVRHGWNRHAVRILGPVWPDIQQGEDADCLRMTQEIFDVFDREIRASAGQWFWYNKRWVLEPL
ncbi:MAG: lysophospholipid acyltransferase family protein [Kiritimatiellia bacterium]